MRKWFLQSRARSELAVREQLHHLLQCEGVIADLRRLLLYVRPRRLDRFAVVVERLRFAEARDAGVP